MTLEPIGAEAADALAAVHALAFDHGWSATDIADILNSPGAFALAVRQDGAPHAFILCRAIAGEAEILTLAIHPALRRRGLGRALLTAAIGAAQAAAAEAMFLEVAADNAAAIGLYAGAGFIRVGARPEYYRRAEGAIDAIAMRRDLNSRAG
jgi:[ribosomal protein S18]-alanine N-acetyltransferase